MNASTGGEFSINLFQCSKIVSEKWLFFYKNLTSEYLSSFQRISLKLERIMPLALDRERT